VIERRRGQPVEALQAIADRLRDGVAADALAQHLLVEGHQPGLEADVPLVIPEVAVDRAGQLVGGPMLVDQPADLAGVPCEIAGKLGADDQVDRPAVALGQVEQPPRGGVAQDLVLRIPLEGQRDAVGFEAARAQLVDELADQQLGSAPDERHLRFANEDGSDAQRVRNRSMRTSFGSSGRKP
jgi:hypothetical protein